MKNIWTPPVNVNVIRSDCLHKIADVAGEVGSSVPIFEYKEYEVQRLIDAILMTLIMPLISGNKGSRYDEIIPAFHFLYDLLPEASQQQVMKVMAEYESSILDFSCE